jgi:hypothetical protein
VRDNGGWDSYLYRSRQCQSGRFAAYTKLIALNAYE